MYTPRIPWLDRCEHLFTLGTLYFATGILNAVLIGALTIEVDTSQLNLTAVASDAAQAPIFLVIQLGILGLTVLFMALRPARFLSAIGRPWLIWAYSLFVVISCLWTPDPASSFRRSLFLLATTLFGVYFAGRYAVREQMLLVASALGISAFTNLTFGLLFPAYARHVMYFAGAWRGMLAHKNAMAQLAVLSALMLQLVLPFRDRQRWWHWAALIVSVLLVILSTSKTGLLLLILFSLLLPGLRSLRIDRVEAKLAIVMVFLLILTIGVAFVGNFELILTSLGRDPTLTGRTDIWGVLLQKVGKRLWWGYGYEGFWGGGMQGEAIDLWYSNRYIVDTAHNGFLDMLLQVGVVGLGIFLLSWVMNLWRGWQWLMGWRSPDGLYPLAIMVNWLLYNLSESNIPDAYSINWIIYVSVTTSLLLYRPNETLPIPADPRLR